MDLKALYTAVADGTLEAFLEAHPEMVDPEVAEAARDDVRGAAGAGRSDVVFVAATSAAMIYLRLGDRERALVSRIDAIQALFFLADDPASYDNARQNALVVAGYGRDIGSQATVFRSLVLAADCAWFAADAAGTSGAQDAAARLLQALADVANAAEAAAPVSASTDQRAWLERLASLLAVVAEAAMSRVWPDEVEASVETLLRRLATGADVLPIDLSYEGVGGPGKAAEVAVALATLEQRYGGDG